jgi:UDP-glucuronate 4-epimerase
MNVLVTGYAGFIGAHVVSKLLSNGHFVVGLDNFNDYYEVSLKHDRVSALISSNKNAVNFSAVKGDFSDSNLVKEIFSIYQFHAVIHLGAQAGVRYSIENPQSYIDSNITGTLNILENCKNANTPHLIYASSSSVYGNSKADIFTLDDPATKPVSMYAATKRMNEMMAHVYNDMYKIPTTGLRFFTVYGPWGRPDMAPVKFAKAISKNEPITLYNYGDHYRDFTYIDDIVAGIYSILIAGPKACTRPVYNIGAAQPIHMLNFVKTIEGALGKKAETEMVPMQPGDVYSTHACVEALRNDFGYSPSVGVEEGVSAFVEWFNEYRL